MKGTLVGPASMNSNTSSFLYQVNEGFVLIATNLESCFHITSLPNASDINLTGTRVFPLTILAGTSNFTGFSSTCEDDKSALGMFCRLLEANPLIDELYKAGAGREAVQIIKDKSPDILILDIDLPDIDGIQVAKIACDLNPEVAIAFVTGYPDFAAESFAVHPNDYIIKPVDVERFQDTVNKMAVKLECDTLRNKLKLTGKLPLRTEDGIMFLNLDDIIFIEKNGKETIIHKTNGTHKCNYSLKDLERGIQGCH